MQQLILLHGALGHPDTFQPFMQHLSAEVEIHTPLFSGHGNSEISKNGITIETYADELGEYIHRKKLNNVHIFGHSMGGYAALLYALKNPSSVKSVSTLGTKFDWNENQAAQESKILNPEIICEKVPKYAELLQAQHGKNWKNLLSSIAELMILLGKNPPLKNTLENIACPVQIMVGDQDQMVSVEESLKVCAAIPSGRFAVLPNTRHPLDKVRPKLLAALLSDFLT